jgi:CubicO group peptidase (beta-lactamase class C family)
MSTRLRKRSKFSTWMRRIGIFFLLSFIGFNVYLGYTGKWYFYTALTKTYFIGQKGPGIYDKDLFPYRTIEPAKEEKVFNQHPKSPAFELTKDELDYIKQWKTTSFLVMRNDTILFEKYWGDHDENTVSNTFSTAKSVVGLLIGIAIEEGYIGGLDESASLYIPEFDNGELRPITIRHLLTMSPGLNWHESGGNPFSDNAEAYYGKELTKKVLSQKPIRKSGEVYEYISSSTQLLTMILEKATGKNLSTYFGEKIWSKIGTGNQAFWSMDREDGIEKGYCCLYATTRDFAKIGLLIQQNGNWNGEQVVPEWYLRESFTPAKIKTLSGKDNQRYGLHWWVVPTAEDTIKYARGIQGQYIAVIPSKNLILVRTGHKRTPDYGDNPEDADQFPALIQPQGGHPPDLFVYLRIALRIAAELP